MLRNLASLSSFDPQYTSTIKQWLFRIMYNLRASSHRSINSGEKETIRPKYERDIPQLENTTADQVVAISLKSCSVLNTLGPKIQQLHGYVTQDQIYCVCIAPYEERVREHARQDKAAFPRTGSRN